MLWASTGAVVVDIRPHHGQQVEEMGLIDVSIEGSDVRYSRKIVYVERSVLEDSSAPILPAGNRRGGVELLTELALVLFATVRLLLQLDERLLRD